MDRDVVDDANISSIEGWSSTLGAEGREDDRRDDIHRELRDVRELKGGDEDDGMEDEEEERAKGGSTAGGEGDDGWLALLVIVMGEVDAARGGGCERGGERDEIGKDKDGVANGFSFGRGGSLGPDDAGPSPISFPLPLGTNSESESKSKSDTSSSLSTACPSALISPSRPTPVS